MEKNPYFKNLSKIEFVVTDACTGNCKHCSQGAHKRCGSVIDARLAADAVTAIVTRYPIETLLTFGGEPLLAPSVVARIQAVGKAVGIPHRQVITNGYVTRDASEMRRILLELKTSGVNDLRLSVDAFHQETIPLALVKQFAMEALSVGLPILAQPAWLVSSTHDNPYNQATAQILAELARIGVAAHAGNVVFPAGSAATHLAAYFTENAPVDPYVEDPADVRCISFDANGDVLGGNLYQADILSIMADYQP